MRGLMMDFPLTLATIFERAGKMFPNVEIVSRRPDGQKVRSSYGEFYRRAGCLAEALTRAGMRPGDRVATLMWNHAGHLEAYFGVPVAGGVLHTLNLRLHPNEIAYIARHAGDRFLIVDDVLLPVYEKFREQVKLERVWVTSFGGAGAPAGMESYEELLGAATGEFVLPKLDENAAAAMCFTSGTTGNPKGVVYSHRSIVLHSFAEAMVDTFAMSQEDTLLAVAPMFHANAWGLPFTATMCGTRVVYPGPHVDAASLLDLIVQERVTMACGVPTVWLGVLDALEKHPGRWKINWPMRIPSGGMAPPESLIRGLDRHGIRLIHLWGLTETSPLGTTGRLKAHMREWPEEKQYEVRVKQGCPAPFVELRVMRPEGEAPWDGKTVGEIEVRGPWVASAYYESPETAGRWTADGWFKTGDVATIDAEGYVKIADRAKDLVKSGGEWISSVDLENALMGHPAVREAAVIAVPHPKWQERPLAVLVLKDGMAQPSEEELREFLMAKNFAKWQVPDAFVVQREIPRTSVGKFMKIKLREQFAEWKWGKTD